MDLIRNSDTFGSIVADGISLDISPLASVPTCGRSWSPRGPCPCPHPCVVQAFGALHLQTACRRLNLLLLSHQVLTCGRFWLRLSCAPQHYSATCKSLCCRYFPCTQRVPSSVYMHLHLYLQVYFRYSGCVPCIS